MLSTILSVLKLYDLQTRFTFLGIHNSSLFTNFNKVWASAMGQIIVSPLGEHFHIFYTY